MKNYYNVNRTLIKCSSESHFHGRQQSCWKFYLKEDVLAHCTRHRLGGHALENSLKPEETHLSSIDTISLGHV